MRPPSRRFVTRGFARIAVRLTMAIGLALTGASAWAHHSIAGAYDSSREATVEGVGGGAELLRGATEFLFEPAAEHVFGALLPHYLNFKVYQILLEAKASEHSSRMVAMKNATDNAKQLIKDLTLEYNKLRQANITKELLEITSAAMSMG